MSDRLLAASIRRLVETHRRCDIDAVALLAPGIRPCTYGQLAEQMDYVGGGLRAAGVERSDTVAIVLPNGAEMATAFLGVASFTTCAPLNPRFQAEELEFYLTDLQAKAVIVPADAESPARDVARRLGLVLMELQNATDRAGCFRFQQSFPARPTDLDDECDSEEVALLLHTSGTTSRPKLVPLSHENLLASAHNIASTLRLRPKDRCLNLMPLFHIHGLVGALCSSLYAGASVVCCPEFEASRFNEWMGEFGPTWYSAVPTIHQAVLSASGEGSKSSNHSQLRLIRSSSSALPPTVMRELEATFNVPVIESYGMTEAAHQMSSNPLPPANRKPGSVGLPAGPDMAIFDDQGNPVAEGEVGEIVIRGKNVTAGYANNPKANEAAFINGWFRTGDLGRVDSEGYIFLTGRTKEMINRGGENISPREIDEALLEHPAVSQAVAFAVPHATLGEDVVAAVVCHEPTAVTESDLRRFLFDRLAMFKVPSRILAVKSIPKGPTGKIQRIGLYKALEDELRMRHVSPRNDLEESIVTVFEQVLQLEQVGATDNFFTLGGDSLKAARVIAQLSTEYQVELPAVSLFLHPTVEELGLQITRRLGEDAGVLEELLAEVESMSHEEARRQID